MIFLQALLHLAPYAVVGAGVALFVLARSDRRAS